ARQGGVNQALVFYHFGSVEELMVAALERAGNRRMARYRDRLEAVTTFSDLVAIAADLHAGPDDPDSPALAAIVAAWSTSSDLGPRIVELLQPWNDLLAAAIRRALVGSPLAPIVPADELAHGIAALFLGIEVLDRLDPTSDMTGRLFTALQAMATMVEPTLAALQSLDSSSSDG
ncbi:MAG: TetR/AcrR family transcriptional regulator, partial [Acidimicrobiales bacterium]